MNEAGKAQVALKSREKQKRNRTVGNKSVTIQGELGNVVTYKIDLGRLLGPHVEFIHVWVVCEC